MIREPMLCYRPKKQEQLDITKLRYPLYVSPKLDGFRALITPETNVVSRRLREFPNRYVQKTFGLAALIGLDGELIAGDPTAPDAFLRSQTAVMSEDAIDKELKFYVFDYFLAGDRPFRDRLARIVYDNFLKQHPVVVLEQTLVEGPEEVEEIFDKHCREGYEGIILRNPRGLYKQGRSTLSEQYLLKYKPFEDSEAEILEVEEMMHNDNPAMRDNVGRMKRSKQASGMRPAGMLGRIKVVDHNKHVAHSGVPFYLGSGQPFFTLDGRMKYWRIRDELVRKGKRPGKFVKYRYQLTGAKDKPRFGRTLALRDEIDL